jgi:hypothetical protein
MYMYVLHAYVSMRVYHDACMHVYVRVCTYVCICTYMHICMYMHMYVCIALAVIIYMCIYTSRYIAYVQMHTDVQYMDSVHMYVYISIFIRYTCTYDTSYFYVHIRCVRCTDVPLLMLHFAMGWNYSAHASFCNGLGSLRPYFILKWAGIDFHF